jgi:hypothetical protein
MVARTADWQALDRLPKFFCRHIRASLPPGVTPEQCDMKSERQLARSALCCALVICACAVVAADERCARGQRQNDAVSHREAPDFGLSWSAFRGRVQTNVTGGADIVSGKNLGANGR